MQVGRECRFVADRGEAERGGEKCRQLLIVDENRPAAFVRLFRFEGHVKLGADRRAVRAAGIGARQHFLREHHIVKRLGPEETLRVPIIPLQGAGDPVTVEHP
jgi:hypothetical protein